VRENRQYAFVGFLYRIGPRGARIILADIITYKLVFATAVARSRGRRRRLLFHPDTPPSWHVLYKLAHTLGASMSTDTSRPALAAVSYETVTHKEIAPALATFGQSRKVINIGATDISKERVERAFAATFQRTTFVDPGEHHGLCVAKSDDNARHDGEVLTCPTPRRDGYVYQRVIDNCVGDRVLDIRVPIIGESIPFVYFKYRPVATRFSNTNERAELRATADELSPEERGQLLAFSRSMGVDYGELDVLRDAGDQLLYVVDVNTTPSGPPNGLGRRDRIRAIIRLSRSFDTEFLPP